MNTTQKRQKRVIVALDRPTEAENIALIHTLNRRASWYKVGMKQFYQGASSLFAAIKAQKASLFLDLKLHDIPATVEGAARNLARFRPDLATVHAAGGSEMIKAAIRGFQQGGSPQTKIIAVTVLTSLDNKELTALGMTNAKTLVLQFAKNAIEAGAHGIVCSPHEVATLRALFQETLLITPGIRLPNGNADDQKRVATPSKAFADGADLIVVGRAIHQANDPAAAFDQIVQNKTK